MEDDESTKEAGAREVLEESAQVLRQVKFVTKKELDNLPNVHPPPLLKKKYEL